MIIAETFLKLKRDMHPSVEAASIIRSNDKSTLSQFVVN